ncbi:hypothetical protein CSB96_0015 [Pseudomonas aeruginosa]|nr:hypothetical protein CSB96_0015 [Pseudomonas aeruginosa]
MITILHDVAEAAEFLRWKRERKRHEQEAGALWDTEYMLEQWAGGA